MCPDVWKWPWLCYKSCSSEWSWSWNSITKSFWWGNKSDWLVKLAGASKRVELSSEATSSISSKPSYQSSIECKITPGQLSSNLLNVHQAYLTFSELARAIDSASKVIVWAIQATCPTSIRYYDYRVKMISDDDLYRLAIFLGSAAMLLIILYHFLEINAVEEPSEGTKIRASSAKADSKTGSVGRWRYERKGWVELGLCGVYDLGATSWKKWRHWGRSGNRLFSQG